MFGNSCDVDGFQRETTPLRPVSPYGCSKLYAHSLCHNYRNAYNIFAVNGILFNHTSPRRGETFVEQKIVQGAVAIFNLMEDAATAEISRSQIWQWIHNGVLLEDGTPITSGLVKKLADEEIAKLSGDATIYQVARDNFIAVAVADEYLDFLTLSAYSQMP